MQDPLKFVLAAGIGTLLLVSLVVLRIYLVRTSRKRQGPIWYTKSYLQLQDYTETIKNWWYLCRWICSELC